jgi:hypothetical protein
MKTTIIILLVFAFATIFVFADREYHLVSQAEQAVRSFLVP